MLFSRTLLGLFLQKRPPVRLQRDELINVLMVMFGGGLLVAVIGVFVFLVYLTVQSTRSTAAANDMRLMVPAGDSRPAPTPPPDQHWLLLPGDRAFVRCSGEGAVGQLRVILNGSDSLELHCQTPGRAGRVSDEVDYHWLLLPGGMGYALCSGSGGQWGEFTLIPLGADVMEVRCRDE